MWKSIGALAVTWFPMAYVIAAWIGCAWYAFDEAFVILAIGVFVGITIPGYYSLKRRDLPKFVVQSDEPDLPAKVALIIVGLCICAILVYQIDQEFRVYKTYIGGPIFAIGMIYLPAVVLGVASTGYVKLIVILAGKLGPRGGDRLG